MRAPGRNEHWFKSSRSSAAGHCVEVAMTAGEVAVRDSKDTAGAILRFDAAQWTAFIAGVQAGEFDRRDA